MEKETESHAWKDFEENSVLICTYKITDPNFPYNINQIRLRYSYKQDIVTLLDIDNKKICMAVSIGYIRVRDRMTYKAYGSLIFQQIESILAGKPVEMFAETPAAEVAAYNISETPIRDGNYISFSYSFKNIQGFKPHKITLSLFCKRCSTLNIKIVGGDDKDIIKNTKTRFECIKCTKQMCIDSTFHLIIPTGENKNNIMRLEYTGMFNVSIREIVVSGICSTCGSVQIFDIDKKTVCKCGCVLEIQKDKYRALEEIIVPNSSLSVAEKKMSAKDNINALMKTEGTCKHYKKSSRIFIFLCCNGRYACDICHDMHESHQSIRASRMVCGKCGVESQVSPVCGSSICKAELTGKRSSFWEGGKGSRNKTTMSKKDSKKYSR